MYNDDAIGCMYDHNAAFNCLAGYEELTSTTNGQNHPSGEHTDLGEESAKIKHSGASSIKLHTETITAE